MYIQFYDVVVSQTRISLEDGEMNDQRLADRARKCDHIEGCVFGGLAQERIESIIMEIKLLQG